MTEKKKSGSTWKVLIIFVVLVGGMVAYYFYLDSNQNADRENRQEYSMVDEVLAKDLEKYYPASPKAVVQYYSEITKCFYNETYEEAELYLLADKISQLYDEDLVASDENEWNDYIRRLTDNVRDYQQNGAKIHSYEVSSSTDVEYFEEDGFDWARLYCAFTVRTGATYTKADEVFLLRKNETGHWKIYGWALVEDMF